MEQSVDVVDLKEYLRIIRKRKLIIIILPLVAVLASAVLSFYVIKPTYEANTTMIVGKPADGPKEVVNEYNMVLANKQLAKTYGEIAKSRSVLQKVAGELKLTMPVEELKNRIKVNSVGDTELIAISVQDSNPQLAGSIANSLARNFTERVVEIKKVQHVSVVDKAIAPDKPVKPKKLLNIAIAGILGLMAAVALVFLLEFLDDSIKSPEDIQKHLGLPVLGIIPSFNLKESRAMEGRESCADSKQLNHSRTIPITGSRSIPRVTD